MSDSELWSVAIAPNNVQTMTLDQLDAAFQRGLIPENALVWTEGMDTWLRLREVLGEEEPVAAAAVPSAFPPVVARPASSVAPAAAPTSAPMSVPPMSTAPVALSLGDDFELQALGPSKKAKWGYLAAAAVVLGGLGFTAANVGSGAEIDPSKAAAAAMPISAGDEPLSVPVAAPPDAPLAAGGYKISAAEEARFKAEAEKDAEQRAKIAAALASRPPELAKPKRSGGGGGGRDRNANSSSPIKKGGSKFDPLNGALP